MSPTAGLGFKPQHFAEATTCPAAGLWFEIHAENYMVDGGPRLAMLDALRAEHPISVHGVGLSLASAEPPDAIHLNRLARLVDRCEPFLVSEHLAWCRLEDRCFPDLLPFPRSNDALRLIVRNIDIVQNALRRPILIENPSLYIDLDGHDWSETGFLSELVARTGCGLLVDLNNVVVSGHDLGFDPAGYLAGLPGHAIGEYHLAGHSSDVAAGLLIDSHDAPVGDGVWSLFDAAVDRFGSRPTLIERDGNLPSFDEMLTERERAVGQSMPDLAAFQASFAARMTQPCAARDGYAVHRNNWVFATVEVLADIYPTVRRLIGADAFEATAIDFIAQEPPASPIAGRCGPGFADFLCDRPWAAELPYLPDVATIDRFHLDAMLAADAEPVDASSLVGLAPADWATLRLRTHPAMRIGWFTTPAPSIWLAHREDQLPDLLAPDWQAEGILITRPTHEVHARLIGRAEHRFLFGLRLGETVSEAAIAATSLYPDQDFAAVFARTLESGALAAPHP